MLVIISGIMNYVAYAAGWILLITVTLKVTLGPAKFQSLRDKGFAYFMEYVSSDLYITKTSLQKTKAELFSSMKTIKSVDKELSMKNAVSILEIGGGTGTNLGFYPAGSRLQFVDPNPEFEVFFRRHCLKEAAHLDPDIRFTKGRGEFMTSVADGSVDVVVCTLVMCSVTHLDQIFSEIRRVLVPGGKFYFLDHVAHPAGTWRRWLQDALSHSGLWPALFNGCVLNRQVLEVLIKSGFSKVDHHSAVVVDKQLRPPSTPLSGLAVVGRLVYGEVTK